MKSFKIENINAWSTIVVALCTVAITYFTYQTTELSQQMFFTSQEPLIETSILEKTNDSRIRFEISNRGNIDLLNVKVFERFYTSPITDLANKNLTGSPGIVPTWEINRLKPSESKMFTTIDSFRPILLWARMRKGSGVGGFVELQLSFQHGVTRKQYLQIEKYLILISSHTEFKIQKVSDEDLRFFSLFLHNLQDNLRDPDFRGSSKSSSTLNQSVK